MVPPASGCRDTNPMVRRFILSVLVIASMAGLAATYEISSLRVARTEAQLAADAAALAGASIFAFDPGAQDAAREEAMRYAELNVVRGVRASLASEDIEVIAEESIIRVTVNASLRPANGAQRLLWLLIGIRGSTIMASAAATARAYDPLNPERLPKVLRLIE